MNRIFLLVIAALLFSLSGCGNPDEVSMQNLEVISMNGEKVNLSQYKGKKVFLNFWATWCGPCRAELPSMEKARKELEAEGYAFVLVSDEKLDLLNRFKEKAPFSFDYYKLPRSVKLLGIFSIPQTYLINSQGEVVKAIEGAHDWSSAENMALLRSLN